MGDIYKQFSEGTVSENVSTISQLDISAKLGQVYIAHHEVMITNGVPYYLEYRIGNKNVLGLDRTVTSEGAFTFKVFEAPIFTPSATQISMPYASTNRKVPTVVPAFGIYTSPTAINLAGALQTGWTRILAAGKGQSSQANAAGGTAFKLNTSYIVQVVNDDTKADQFIFDWAWYEF